MIETVDIKRENVLLLIVPRRPSKNVFQTAPQCVIIDIEDVVMNKQAGMTSARVIIQHQSYVVDKNLLPLDAVAPIIVDPQYDLNNLFLVSNPNLERRFFAPLNELVDREDRLLE